MADVKLDKAAEQARIMGRLEGIKECADIVLRLCDEEPRSAEVLSACLALLLDFKAAGHRKR